VDRSAPSHRPSNASREIALIDSVNDTPDIVDWWTPLITYLRDPNVKACRGVRRTTFKYVLIDNELYHGTPSDILLKCLGPDDATLAMVEVHEDICGTHQSTPKMKWLSRISSFYWPDMKADCFKYYKGCQVCQKFGDLQLVPAAELHPIIKPWPFRGCDFDFVREIHPSSSIWHRFVLVAIDYFTK
jgi:hypothetical protein